MFLKLLYFYLLLIWKQICITTGINTGPLFWQIFFHQNFNKYLYLLFDREKKKIYKKPICPSSRTPYQLLKALALAMPHQGWSTAPCSRAQSGRGPQANIPVWSYPIPTLREVPNAELPQCCPHPPFLPYSWLGHWDKPWLPGLALIHHGDPPSAPDLRELLIFTVT